MKKIIAANWKCNPTSFIKAKSLFLSVKNIGKKLRKVKIIIFPPFLYLKTFKDLLKNSKSIKLGSQNCFWEEKGAFTGEISPKALKDIGTEYVILGHSERRKYFSETDFEINKKIKKALEFNLKPILCIGEREGENLDRIEREIKLDLKDVPKKRIKEIIFAYEPIWAIGTGKNCDPERVFSVSIFIKKQIFKYFKVKSSEIKVLYGGSVNQKNALSYIIQAKVDGLLIGGASLKKKEFLNIIKLVNNASNI